MSLIALSIAGVDLFVVDSAHGHSKNVVETIKLIKKEFKDIDVMGGNVATPEGAIALRDAGADAIKLQTYTADTITLNVKSDDFRNYIGDILVECVQDQLEKGKLFIDE